MCLGWIRINAIHNNFVIFLGELDYKFLNTTDYEPKALEFGHKLYSLNVLEYGNRQNR
ncbi:hypothetical protein [Coleofasciculus sp.]|uniref:hypothetical protein n=1 Tax=Coleofasciculus sp. TaxID=3100458 RepID=UPI003A2DCDB0